MPDRPLPSKGGGGQFRWRSALGFCGVGAQQHRRVKPFPWSMPDGEAFVPVDDPKASLNIFLLLPLAVRDE
jgi:hypothetical protein